MSTRKRDEKVKYFHRPKLGAKKYRLGAGLGDEMSEYQPVKTKADLELLDDDEVVAGYMAGFKGAAEPGSDKSRSYWHGWRNGMVDSKRVRIDDAQMMLAREVVGRYVGLH